MSEYLRMPEILVADAESGLARFELGVSKDLTWFSGHFPDHPVLPGVVLVDWAWRLGCEQLGISSAFRGLRSVKFHRRIGPGERIVLELRLAADRLNWYYRTASGEAVPVAEGEIRLGEAR